MRAATAGTAARRAHRGLIVAAGTAALVAGRLDFSGAFGPGLAISGLIAVARLPSVIPACLALFGRPARAARARAGAAPATRREHAVARRRLADPLRVRLARPLRRSARRRPRGATSAGSRAGG